MNQYLKNNLKLKITHFNSADNEIILKFFNIPAMRASNCHSLYAILRADEFNVRLNQWRTGNFCPGVGTTFGNHRVKA